ncbi:MAG: hypothetical protein JWR77_479, partial [Rhizorhabdus sp.]|nr:hypothetical protein [Rhizorhabdus sp.]
MRIRGDSQKCDNVRENPDFRRLCARYA